VHTSRARGAFLYAAAGRRLHRPPVSVRTSAGGAARWRIARIVRACARGRRVVRRARLRTGRSCRSRRCSGRTCLSR